MNRLTHLIYVYPREAQYSQIPAEYDVGGIEDYGCVLTQYPLAVGDIHSAPAHQWIGNEWHLKRRPWQVAEVFDYQSLASGGPSFSTAVLTFDGAPATVDGDDHSPSILQILAMPKGFKISWPNQPEYCIQEGEVPYDSEGCVAQQVHRFLPPVKSPHWAYDEVRFAWCAPATSDIAESELVAA